MTDMIRKDGNVKEGLQKLGLTQDEIEIYLALLHAPSAPLSLSRQTGIKRTKIYSLLDSLEKRSLIARQTDERGTYFVVTETTNLGIELSEREIQLKEQQRTFHQIMPMLDALRGAGGSQPFVVRTYENTEGLKQMLWHELKARGELLSFGGGDIEELIPDPAWAAKQRERVVKAGYRVREIINSETDLPTNIENHGYLQLYNCRGISAQIVSLEDQIIIYNDTVAIYNWRHDYKVGVEIISKTFANTMRSTFEYFWKLTEPTNSRS